MQSQINVEGYNSETITVDGLRTHYLDFGGEGLNVILIHSEAWDAYTYKNFGPLLTDNNRVLAITRPGYGKSEKGAYDVKKQGDHIIKFANSLNIKRAVFIGNASASAELTYLAENYPQKVAGVVYLNGLSVPWLEEYYTDPFKSSEMFLRSSPSSNPETSFIDISRARKNYRPNHYKSDSIKINVPALAIVNKNGRQGSEKGLGILVFVGSSFMEEVRNEIPPSPTKDFLNRIADDPQFRGELINNIQDSVARQYYLKLASDTIMQRKVYMYHTQSTYPAMLEAQEKLKNAFGENLQLEKINVNQIVGYEYRDSPELIIEPIKEFLKQINSN
ncbi:alpha/beta hydrolase [Gramella sp. MT6]|uniref:alpha/beta fold hydrolase n=1 Tax=Gramella sp. MT6 TaxID=2705471 RepID=UPI001C5E5C42|nr:alpha/beta hydrolase [Gramella sp. MT6]QYA26686.1 alpha/beta hydrolase [Gramella sp. MT6]